MFEIEQKFHLPNRSKFEARLQSLRAECIGVENHSDTYYNHPCRDFAETKEALRIRRIDGVPHITYKGAKYPGDVKARRELEWQLAPGDGDGAQTEELLVLLGFRRVAEVKKRRQVFKPSGIPQMTIVIDDVENLGQFAEVERVIQDAADIENARHEVLRYAEQLGLQDPEPRSYLRILLER
ncbi:CYTH domain protein [Novipirellula aureliae]|uniref:CYTH domain protein n=1 Tax=Novipirellula aureliae TaxID=2527966 RepID=A0A5C6DXN9_9BACT|nr:class IV adenylate cyclase [Novipirellula aureliae]TWU41175.1 CYTH domain protein [Novipirellula aureliae]